MNEYQTLVESQYSGRVSKADSDDSLPKNQPTHDLSGDSTQFNRATTNLQRVNSNSTLISENSSTQNFIHEATTRDNQSKRWHHVQDLDSFFKSVYDYHQGHGFFNIVLRLALELLQFSFTVVFVIILTCCVDYDSIFKNKYNGTDVDKNGNPIVPDDWHRPWSIVWDKKCSQNILNSSITFHIFLLVAILCFIIRLYRSIKCLINFTDIRAFYRDALKITALDNHTWYEIQAKLLQVQSDVQLCIHKDKLSELDVYNRILRFKNYMVALANKNLLPSITLPILGETEFLSHSLKFNYSLLFFNSAPFNLSVFENNFKLRDEYKQKKERRLVAAHLSKTIALLAVVNLVFAPFILLWQLIYSFFTYVEMAKREPALFGLRRWTEYSRLKLRHFNELEHEFQARLARAYRPGTKYFNCFPDYTLIILAEYLSYILGSIVAVMVVLTAVDEDVLKIEHALTLMAVLTAVVGILRGMIPADDALFCPEELMKTVATHVHYLPAEWKCKAHTSEVRTAFDKMFQLRPLHIVEELLSPFVVPYLLFFKLRPKSLEIVDFFRCFTIHVDGTGDVCSFAMMDLLRHGDPMWNHSTFKRHGREILDSIGSNPDAESGSSGSGLVPGTTYDIAQNGKTEKSLLHFQALNPKWQPSDNQVRNWVESNLYRRRQDVEPGIAELMSSQATYKYLSVTKQSIGTSSRDMPIDSAQLYGMNASMLRLQDSHGDGKPTSLSQNVQPEVSVPRPFQYQESSSVTASNNYEMSTRSTY